jgi:hypothetical protein
MVHLDAARGTALGRERLTRQAMAHIWTRSEVGEWQTVALGADACVLTIAGPAVLAVPRPSPADDPAVFEVASDEPTGTAGTMLLRRVAGTNDDIWVLLAGSSARPLVNGFPAPHGIVVLADRDEIRWPAPLDLASSPADPFFFSTERLATVVTYPDGTRRGSCPRCKQPLSAGDAAVRCPGCGLWHHATEALPCWTYGEQCAACPQPTPLDAGFQWTPEEL